MKTNAHPTRHLSEYAEEAQPEAATVARRVLVVDDDEGMRDVVATALAGAGYRVSRAEDGEAAWEALCAETYDVLITDHEMPRLTGLDLLRRVRTRARQLPVILISGRMPGNETDLQELLPPGLAMRKPFSFVELLAKVRSVTLSATRARPAQVE